MKKISSIIAVFALAFTPLAFGQSANQNQVTFSTFTAPPIAHYHHLWLEPNDDLSDPCEPGTIFFSLVQNDLVYCQDDGSGNGTFSILGGGFWKKTGNNIYPKDTETNPDLKVGIGTTAPDATLEVFGDILSDDNKGSKFYWNMNDSLFSAGSNFIFDTLVTNAIGFNLGLVTDPTLSRPNTFAIVGGSTIIGGVDHTHISGGALPLPINAVLTTVGDTDVVGKLYVHDDMFVEGDVNFNSNVTFPSTVTFNHITTNTIQVNASGVVAGSSCPNSGYEWCVNGEIWADGYNNSSDERLKTNITPVTRGLDTIDQLKPVTFQWKEYSKDESGNLMISDEVKDERHVGLLAQDVYKVLPEVVVKPEDESKEIWGIRYDELIPVLIQAVKEQKSETDALKADVEKLKMELKALQK